MASIAIVVDTDLVQAASAESTSEHAVLCAQILRAIAEGNFLLALSDPILREWFAPRDGVRPTYAYHLSYFAQLWLGEMVSRRKVRFYKPSGELGGRILGGFDDSHVRERVEKDLPIVLTALAADRRLISGNRRERFHFQKACAWCWDLKDLLWPWPLKCVPGWLGAGAPAREEHYLCPANARVS